MTVLEQIGKWASSTREGTLSPRVRQRLAIHLLDTAGAWVAGGATEEAAKMRLLGSSASEPSRLFTDTLLDAVALRIATIRLTEIDDIHMPSCTTPSSVVVPTALTLAAWMGKPNAQTFAHALHVGYEMMTRLGTAIAGPNILYRGIWPTYLTAPVGAAATTARMLGLDDIKTANALGMALTLIGGGVGVPAGLSPRWLLLGIAARAGCAAAFMAANGYAGDRTCLDGDWLVRTHGIQCDAKLLAAAPQEDGAVDALSIKPYCAAKQTISSIDAFQKLLASGVLPDDIIALKVIVPPAYAGMIGHRNARAGRIPRITSVSYHLALAAYRPDGMNDIVHPDLTTDPRIAAFMERITVIPDESLMEHYPQRWPARVEATIKGGHTMSEFVLDAHGDPARAFDAAAACDKFHQLADLAIGRPMADKLAEACLASTEQDDALATLYSSIRAIEAKAATK